MKNSIYLLFALAIMFSACVPLAQYKQLEEDKLAQDAGYEQLRNENYSLDVTNTELKSRIMVLDKQIKRLDDDLLNVQRNYNRIEDKYKKTNELYQNLLKIQTELASGTDRESSRILKELQALQQSLMEKEDRLVRLESSLNQKRRNLEQLQEEFGAQNSRLMELESVLSHKDSIMNGLRAKVAQALYAFESDELSVELKNGKVYISLEEKLLFGSGSYSVAAKGEDALKKLAGVLELNPDIQILIEGHTDNVPINSTSNYMIDNWDLSVKRATSIVRILLDNSSIDPKRLTAAGRGEFLPVADNAISEGKQKNRRTEIILTPRLDELFNLIGN
ncbi:MAG: OmpA family protein [Bacteroidales bacterium]|nr:OmpA family protein [Bacteroidales bacterium]